MLPIKSKAETHSKEKHPNGIPFGCFLLPKSEAAFVDQRFGLIRENGFPLIGGVDLHLTKTGLLQQRFHLAGAEEVELEAHLLLPETAPLVREGVDSGCVYPHRSDTGFPASVSYRFPGDRGGDFRQGRILPGDDGIHREHQYPAGDKQAAELLQDLFQIAAVGEQPDGAGQDKDVVKALFRGKGEQVSLDHTGVRSLFPEPPQHEFR